MWIMTNIGFYSVVESSRNKDLVVVRARAKKDLENLRKYIPGLKIVELDMRDYQYRAFVKRNVWERTIKALTADIDYTNFKDSVKKVQGHDRANVYMRIWSTLLDVSDGGGNSYMDRWRWDRSDDTSLARAYTSLDNGTRGRVQPLNSRKKKSREAGQRTIPFTREEMSASTKPDSDECPVCNWPLDDGCMCRWPGLSRHERADAGL